MNCFDLIIIGGGAAGAAAALAAPAGRTLVLDVGGQNERPLPRPSPSRLEALNAPKADLFDLMIGQEMEGMALVGGRSQLSPKLKAPQMRFITRNWENISPTISQGFSPQMSFAKGGLANGWGAGVYRYNDRDLEGFPIKAAELAPFFDALTKHVGISGTADDLESYFGSTVGLHPPLRMNRGPKAIFDRYKSRRDMFASRGFRMGRPRLAVLTREHEGRPPYRYHNLEFFVPNEASIYSPAITFQHLEKQNHIDYRRNFLVETYTEKPDHVEVRARDLTSNQIVTFRGRALAIAAGCLNSAKIVLASEGKVGTKVPLLDNLVSYVPLLNLGLIGSRNERRCFGMGQLNIVYEGELSSEAIQGTLYDLSGPMRSDIIMDFPLAAKGKLAASRHLAQAMCLLQFFYPDDRSGQNSIELLPNGSLSLNYVGAELGKIERAALAAFRRIGWFGLPALCKYPPAGSSYHYAGSFPMRHSPGPLETNPNGRLAGRNRVYLVDSSVFTRLPSKNLTFTSMANAMRIVKAIPSDS